MPTKFSRKTGQKYTLISAGDQQVEQIGICQWGNWEETKPY